MAGLAVLLKARGLKVTGCDLVPSSLADWLGSRGIRVAAEHAPSHITKDVRWVIRSSAVPVSAPEIKTARRRRCGVFRRGETLAAIVNGLESVAVAGTHGKTTTTGLITQILVACGKDPSFCIGGEVRSLGGVAGCGSGGTLVVEADESDGTLELYRPDYAVITNIEADHMEHFGSMAALRDCFRRFMNQTRRKVVYCADDTGASMLCAGSPGGISYGFSKCAMIRGVAVKLRGGSSIFSVTRDGCRLGGVCLPLPGLHNVANALAAITVSLEMGLGFEEVRKALGRVVLPRRRFEKVIDDGDLVVISDYAHHPSEIQSLVSAARRLGRKRILAVFQPHRYTRTLALGPDFASAFAGVDEVVLAPVYAASEPVISGGTSADLYIAWRKLQPASGAPPVMLAGSLEQAWDYYSTVLRKGDLLLVVGAGDVEQIAHWAGKEYRKRCKAETQGAANKAAKLVFDSRCSSVSGLRLEKTCISFNESMARKSTMRVGGSADVWMDIGSKRDLVRIFKKAVEMRVPFGIIGAGSNLVVSDLGVRGITARLSGAEFKSIQPAGDTVICGAGLPLAQLLAWLEKHGMGGLEFLEGIPGTVGGAVSMNAGAFGGETGHHVEWIRIMDGKGKIRLIGKPEFGYRSGVRCPAVLEVCFRVECAARTEIRARRKLFSGRRSWMRGMRCAGSVFRNPPDDHAGRLIELAGLKGTTAGGAMISTRHANVIETGKNANASDVIALLEKARTEVRLKHGVNLENEVLVME